MKPGPLLPALLLLACALAAVAAAEPPAVTALVLDTSGSVGRAGLVRTRELALGILGSLPGGSEVAVFTFDDQSRLLLPRTSDPERVRRALSSAAIAGRHTALYDALFDASRYLRDSPGGRRAIVLITDGRDEDSALNLDDGLRLAQETRIPVFAAGVGRVEERVLRRIAKLTGGQYVAGAEAKGSAIATQIMALPAQRSAVEAASAKAPPAASGQGTPAPAMAAPNKPAAAASKASRGWPAWTVAALLVVLAGAAVSFFALRSRQRPRCPTCLRELPSPLSSCAFCASAPVRQASEDQTIKADISPTVLARLSDTEEYLEKTVTLRERPVLSVTRGPGTGQLFELSRDSATSIGRAKANDIVLQDVAVSGQHCRIRLEDGGFVLHDLKSTNGTLVNEKRVTRHPLSDGDVLQIGETFLQFHTEHRRN